MKVVLYTRPGCHLCDDAMVVLQRVRRQIPFALETVNIAGDQALESLYRHHIPVVTIDGEEAFRHRVDETTLRARLRPPLESESESESASESKSESESNP